MKKNNPIVSICYIAVGMIFLLAALFTETKLDGLFSGMAGAGIVPGIMMLYRYFYWKSPKHSQQYQELLENEQIERRDELKEKVRGITARYTHSLGMLVTSIAMLVFAVLGSLDVKVNAYIMVLYLGCFLTVQIVASVVIFNRILKKYL